MAASRNKVDHALQGDAPVYALNTGVGLLATCVSNVRHIEQMQVNLVRSHCCGVGQPLPTDVVRAMMAIRANTPGVGPLRHSP